MIRLVKLTNGESFIGKRTIVDQYIKESWGCYLFTVLSSQTIPAGSRISVPRQSIVYMADDKKKGVKLA